MMTNWTQKKQLMSIACATGLVCSAAAGGVYYVSGLIAEVEAEVTLKRGELKVADTKIAKIPSLEQEVVILRENLGEYVKILPDDDQLNEFVRMVNRFGGQSGVRGASIVVWVSPLPPARSERGGPRPRTSPGWADV